MTDHSVNLRNLCGYFIRKRKEREKLHRDLSTVKRGLNKTVIIIHKKPGIQNVRGCLKSEKIKLVAK
jgi:hypothetical protein